MDQKASSLSVKDQTLYQIQYLGHVMLIQMGIRLTPSVSHATVKNLLLVQRETKQELLFPLEVMETDGALHLLQADIDFLAYPGMDQKETTWDLYITVEIGDDRRSFRLRSNDQTLEMLLFAHPDWHHFIVPYATDQGNASFQVREKQIFSGIEEASIRKGILTLQGYAFYPLWDVGDHELEKYLVLRDEEGDVEKKISIRDLPFQENARQSGGYFEENYSWTWFKATCDIREWQIPDGLGRLKFMMVVESDHRKMESEPVQLKSEASINTTFIKRNGPKQKITLKGKVNKPLSVTVSARKIIKGFYASTRKKLLRARQGKKAQRIYQLLFKASASLLTKRTNLVMFESFLGKQYSCNPRAIYEYMQAHYPDYKLCWSVNKKNAQQFKKHHVPHVKRFTLKWFWYMPRAGYWVVNARMPLWVPKPPKTVYIQTWHGTPLKRLAADMDEVHMPGTSAARYKKNFVKAAQKWDYLVSPNAYSSVIFWRAFRYNGEILETGYPRNDYLHTHNTASNIARIKRTCGIPLDKKVILYAPTWRDDQFYIKGRYKFELDLDLSQMQEALGDEYVILMRMHYLVAGNLDLSAHNGFAYDFSRYEDIRDLYLVSDLLMTDYSSVFFDYANLYRPIIFYTYDLERYRDKLRGFYFDFEGKAPGPLVKTTEDVIAVVRDFEKNDFAVPASFKAFYDRFCYLEDGHASGRVVERVFSEAPSRLRDRGEGQPQPK